MYALPRSTELTPPRYLADGERQGLLDALRMNHSHGMLLCTRHSIDLIAVKHTFSLAAGNPPRSGIKTQTHEEPKEERGQAGTAVTRVRSHLRIPGNEIDIRESR